MKDVEKLAPALLEAQKQIGVALTNAKNPYYKSSYADLRTIIEAVKGPLNKNGIAFLQCVEAKPDWGGAEEEVKGDLPIVQTILLHESGESIKSEIPVYCSKPNDPQALGTGISYAKRYALQAMLGLPTADDDGCTASGKGEKKAPKKKTKKAEKEPETPSFACDKIMDLAFNQYCLVHKGAMPKEGFKWDRKQFDAAVIEHFEKYPTKKESIERIIREVTPKEVLVTDE